jgi:hypothetical protein
MADLKISQLNSIVTVVPATDVLPVVQGGTTYKVTPNQLLGAGGTATLASATITSATITGAATVGTTLGVTGVSTLASVGVTGAATVGTTLLVGTNATLTNGNVIIGTSGKGIDFSATAGTGTSELLDDYEEGTWTPTIIGTTTAGTGTYSLQAGQYTKIGNRVFVEGYISWSAHTGTGNMRIGGLPFTINSSSFYSSGSIGDTSGIALTAGNILAIIGVATSATIDMKQLPTGGGSSAAVPIDTAANISFSFCYLV